MKKKKWKKKAKELLGKLTWKETRPDPDRYSLRTWCKLYGVHAGNIRQICIASREFAREFFIVREWAQSEYEYRAGKFYTLVEKLFLHPDSDDYTRRLCLEILLPSGDTDMLPRTLLHWSLDGVPHSYIEDPEFDYVPLTFSEYRELVQDIQRCYRKRRATDKILAQRSPLGCNAW